MTQNQNPPVPPQAPVQQYAPGYQPMPQTYAPQGLPQAGAQIQHDVDSAPAEGGRFPHPTFAGGAPWQCSIIGSCEEFPSYYGGSIFVINAVLRGSPDPSFPAGTQISVLIKGLGKGEQNNAAQGRLKKFLASACNESEFGQAPGHFAARKQQALTGALNGLPFTVSFTQHTAQKSGKPYLRPIFQAG